METKERKISRYSFEPPSAEDQQITQLLTKKADKKFHPEDGSEIEISGPFDGGTFLFYCNRGGSWSFELQIKNGAATRMQICELRKNVNTYDGVSQSVFYTLVGEKGITENGDTVFDSWRRYNDQTDSRAAKTILGILED